MLRFTIRDVLWLTVVVALTVAWWVEHRQLKAMQEKVTAIWFEANGFQSAPLSRP